MPFSKDLEHLEDALMNPMRGAQKDFTMVRRRALGELLYRFKILDQAARNRHALDNAQKEPKE